MNYDRQSKCPCKNGPKCDYCGYCLGCSCRCHSWFTVHTRLFPLAQEEKLLRTVEETAKAGGADLDDSDSRLSLALERLKHAKGEMDPPTTGETGSPSTGETEEKNPPSTGEMDGPATEATSPPPREPSPQQANGTATADGGIDEPMQTEEVSSTVEESLEIVI